MDDNAKVHYYESMEIDNVSAFSLESNLNCDDDVTTRQRPKRQQRLDQVQDNSVNSHAIINTMNENAKLRDINKCKTHNINTAVYFDPSANNFHESVQEISSKEVCNREHGRSYAHSAQFSQVDISLENKKYIMMNSVMPSQPSIISQSQLPSAEDFVLLKPISKGAFGKVWLGFKKTNPNRMYAIKVMKKIDLINKNLMAQVTAERDAQARSQSAFVVQLYYSLQSQQNILLIMEYMIGGDVKSLLIMYGFFSEEMSCFYAAEVTLALAYLHKLGIVHRDLKPDNMLISNTGHLKLTDFGLSKVTMDYRASPQPGSFTPFGHRCRDYVDLRTPGQILSLKSSLAFAVDTAYSKTSETKSEVHEDMQETTPDSNNSPLPPQPKTPTEKARKLSFGRCKLTPGDIRQGLQVRRLHSTIASTPPVKSLTPTLQDSLSWRNSSASDSQSRNACSILQSALLSRGNGKNNLSTLSVSEDFKDAVSKKQPGGGFVEMDISVNSNANSSFNDQSTSFLTGCGDSIELHDSVRQNNSSKKLQDPLSCDSHIMPIFRVEGEDDETPMLHRTNNSVWSSYAAKNLQSMREGSYSEDNHFGSFCSNEHVNRSKTENVHSCNNFYPCLPLSHRDTLDLVKCSGRQIHCDTSMSEAQSVFAKVFKHRPADSSDENSDLHSLEKQTSIDAFLPHDSNVFSNTSVEVARGVAISLDESLGIIHSYKSRHVSVAGSTDLEVSSDFSAHLQQRDQMLNSTRLSLDFGPSQMSLDSGPELKDLSQLSGLSRVVLKTIPPEDNKSTCFQNCNVVHSNKSERFMRKQSDLAPGSGPVVRKLSKPGLRRVLSDTFDRCLSYSSSHLESSSERNRSILKHKSKSLDYGTDLGEEENIPRPGINSNKFQRKRSFQSTGIEYSNDKIKNSQARTALTPELCGMKMDESDGIRPRKQVCVERKLKVHNLCSPVSDVGKHHFTSCNRLPAFHKKSEHKVYTVQETAESVTSSLDHKHNLDSPYKIVSLSNPPQRLKVAFLRESKSSHVACTGCTGLTDEVSALVLKDIVAHSHAASRAAVLKAADVTNKTEKWNHFLEGFNNQTSENKAIEREGESGRADFFGACSDDNPGLHRVRASVNISSHYDSSVYKLQNTEENIPEAYSKESDVKFYIATPSPGPTMHSSPAPRNVDQSQLIIKKDISTMDSSIGTDCSFLNVTIEYEGDLGQTESRLSPQPFAHQRLPLSPSDCLMSDTDVVQSSEDSNAFGSNQPTYHLLSIVTPGAYSPQVKKQPVSPGGSQQQKELMIGGENSGDKVVEMQHRAFYSAYKRMPSIAEGAMSLEEEEDQAVFAKPLSCADDWRPPTKSSKLQSGCDNAREDSQANSSPFQGQKLMTGPMQTPNPWMRESVFQTPYCTPGAQRQTPARMAGARLQTPLRTPKSVRRGPEVTQDEGRILGTPDYLAPEILLQNPHGFAVDWWALGVCLYEFLTGLPPFNDQTPEAVFENILNRNITWPDGEETLSEESRSVIEKLLTDDADKRPAAKELKAMPFFSCVDWANLLKVDAPFVPQPEDHMDTTYFEPKNAVRNLVLSAVNM